MRRKQNILVDIALLFSIAQFLSELAVKGFIPLNVYFLYGIILIAALGLNLPLIQSVLRLLLPFTACTVFFINLWYTAKVEFLFFFVFFIVWVCVYLSSGLIARVFGRFFSF